MPAHDRARTGAEQVRLTRLDARQDPQAWKALTAIRDARQVSLDVQRLDPAPPAVVGGDIVDGVAWAAADELQVLGERDGRESHGDGLLATADHRGVRRRVVGP